MQALPDYDLERLAGALRQLSRDIVNVVGDGGGYESAYDDYESYDDDGHRVDPGDEVAEGAEEMLSEAELERLERIIDISNLLPAHFLEEGAAVQRSVARVVIPTATGSKLGTGFMVSRSLFMTNNHVLRSAEEAGTASAQFNYQLDSNGNPRRPDTFRFDPRSVFHTNASLDYTLVRVAPRGSQHAGQQWGHIPISGRIGYGRRQHLNIIQHPQGRRKECALQENRITNVRQNVVRYTTDTEPGSSGSPVFNNAWDLVALHHAGGERRNGVWVDNEGIRIDRIVSDLRSHFGRRGASGASTTILRELGL